MAYSFITFHWSGISDWPYTGCVVNVLAFLKKYVFIQIRMQKVNSKRGVSRLALLIPPPPQKKKKIQNRNNSLNRFSLNVKSSRLPASTMRLEHFTDLNTQIYVIFLYFVRQQSSVSIAETSVYTVEDFPIFWSYKINLRWKRSLL